MKRSKNKYQKPLVKSQMSKVKSNFNDGISLIELMLAIAVFVVSSATVAHLFVGSQTSMNYSLEKVQAIFLAKQGIEENRAIRNTDFDSLGFGSSTETVTLNGKEYERTIDISYPSADRAEVSSTVEWETIGREEVISYSEILGKWEIFEEE